MNENAEQTEQLEKIESPEKDWQNTFVQTCILGILISVVLFFVFEPTDIVRIFDNLTKFLFAFISIIVSYLMVLSFLGKNTQIIISLTVGGSFIIISGIASIGLGIAILAGIIYKMNLLSV